MLLKKYKNLYLFRLGFFSWLFFYFHVCLVHARMCVPDCMSVETHVHEY